MYPDDASNAACATSVQQLCLELLSVSHELEDHPAQVRRSEVDGKPDDAGFRTLEWVALLNVVAAEESDLHGDDLAALERCDIQRDNTAVTLDRSEPGFVLEPLADEVRERVARDELEERLFDVVALYDVRGFGEGVAVEFLREGPLLFDGDGLDDLGGAETDLLQGTASESEGGPCG